MKPKRIPAKQWSIEQLRKDGLTCASVEIYDRRIKRSRDLFKFADIIAFSRSHVILAVQSTSRSNVLARVKKILSNPLAYEWCQCCHRMLRVEGWDKVGNRRRCDYAHFDHIACTRIVRGKVQHLEWTVT